jgi:hypothetical protein
VPIHQSFGNISEIFPPPEKGRQLAFNRVAYLKKDPQVQATPLTRRFDALRQQHGHKRRTSHKDPFIDEPAHQLLFSQACLDTRHRFKKRSG